MTLHFSPQETQERPDDYERGESARQRAERLRREANLNRIIPLPVDVEGPAA